MYKSGPTSFDNVFYLPNGEQELAQQRIQIGPWNMSAVDDIFLPHAIPRANIRSVFTTIRNDDGTFWYNIYHMNGENAIAPAGGNISMSDSSIGLVRINGGFFDSADFDATAGSVINRGFCTVQFVI